MQRLVIYGAGGFGRELATAARCRNIALVDDCEAEPFANIPLIASADITASDEIVISVSDGGHRRAIASRFQNFATLVAPTAVIGREVNIGEGSVFCDFTMVTAVARIGRHFHCNIYSYVAHDCEIGDFVTFAPRVCCNGNVQIGDGAYIGTGAVLRNGRPGKPLIIGAGATVGMGAIVTKDVPAGVTVVGNPARLMDMAHGVTHLPEPQSVSGRQSR